MSTWALRLTQSIAAHSTSSEMSMLTSLILLAGMIANLGNSQSMAKILDITVFECKHCVSL